MLLPQNVYPEIQLDTEEIPTRTYKLDTSQKRIVGFVDDKSAILQAVQKIFTTERFAWKIYSQNYGIELENLIGKDTEFVKTVLEGRITDALRGDDRFIRLEDFQVEKVQSDALEISCVVVTTIGDIFFREEWTP